MTQPSSRIIAAKALLRTLEPEEHRLRGILESDQSSSLDKSQAAKDLEILTRRRAFSLAGLEQEEEPDESNT